MLERVTGYWELMDAGWKLMDSQLCFSGGARNERLLGRTRHCVPRIICSYLGKSL